MAKARDKNNSDIAARMSIVNNKKNKQKQNKMKDLAKPQREKRASTFIKRSSDGKKKEKTNKKKGSIPSRTRNLHWWRSFPCFCLENRK